MLISQRERGYRFILIAAFCVVAAIGAKVFRTETGYTLRVIYSASMLFLAFFIWLIGKSYARGIASAETVLLIMFGLITVLMDLFRR